MTNSGDAKLDPAPDGRDSSDTPEENEADTVATPEGDNEFAPDQPLKPLPRREQNTPAIDTNSL